MNTPKLLEETIKDRIPMISKKPKANELEIKMYAYGL